MWTFVSRRETKSGKSRVLTSPRPASSLKFRHSGSGPSTRSSSSLLLLLFVCCCDPVAVDSISFLRSSRDGSSNDHFGQSTAGDDSCAEGPPGVATVHHDSLLHIRLCQSGTGRPFLVEPPPAKSPVASNSAAVDASTWDWVSVPVRVTNCAGEQQSTASTVSVPCTMSKSVKIVKERKKEITKRRIPLNWIWIEDR